MPASVKPGRAEDQAASQEAALLEDMDAALQKAARDLAELAHDSLSGLIDSRQEQHADGDQPAQWTASSAPSEPARSSAQLQMQRSLDTPGTGNRTTAIQAIKAGRMWAKPSHDNGGRLLNRPGSHSVAASPARKMMFRGSSSLPASPEKETANSGPFAESAATRAASAHVPGSMLAGLLAAEHSPLAPPSQHNQRVMEHVLDAKANTKRSQQMPNLAPYTQLSPVSSMQPEQSGFPPSFHNSEQIAQSQSSFPQAPPLQSQPAAAPASLTPEHAQPPESSRQANDKGTNRALHSHPLQRLDFSLEEGQTSDAEDDLPAAMEMSTAASGALLLSPDGPASGSSTTEGSLARMTSSSGFGSRVMPVVKTPIKLVKGAVQSFRSLPARTPPEALMPSQPDVEEKHDGVQEYCAEPFFVARGTSDTSSSLAGSPRPASSPKPSTLGPNASNQASRTDENIRQRSEVPPLEREHSFAGRWASMKTKAAYVQKPFKFERKSESGNQPVADMEPAEQQNTGPGLVLVPLEHDHSFAGRWDTMKSKAAYLQKPFKFRTLRPSNGTDESDGPNLDVSTEQGASEESQPAPVLPPIEHEHSFAGRWEGLRQQGTYAQRDIKFKLPQPTADHDSPTDDNVEYDTEAAGGADTQAGRTEQAPSKLLHHEHSYSGRWATMKNKAAYVQKPFQFRSKDPPGLIETRSSYPAALQNASAGGSDTPTYWAAQAVEENRSSVGMTPRSRGALRACWAGTPTRA